MSSILSQARSFIAANGFSIRLPEHMEDDELLGMDMELARYLKWPPQQAARLLAKIKGMSTRIAPPERLMMGDHVVVHSLLKRPDLNGVEGNITGFRESDGRARVRLEGRGGEFAVSSSNLCHLAHIIVSLLQPQPREPQRGLSASAVL